MIGLEKNMERTESMKNAQLVQQGLLPKKRHFNRVFNRSFVFYRPQDMLSGDFYWVGKRDNKRYLLVGDCTGHGISASLTTVLGLSLFEYTIMNKGLSYPEEILKEVNKRYIESFKGIKGNFDYPWIDLSFLCIDDNEKKLYYASANRKMLHVRKNGEHGIYRTGGFPLGKFDSDEILSFETIELDFSIGDAVYLGTDGFQDQFGGPYGKKYGSNALHDLLIKNSTLSFAAQEIAIEDEFEMWKGIGQQIDDVCIVGVEL